MKTSILPLSWTLALAILAIVSWTVIPATPARADDGDEAEVHHDAGDEAGSVDAVDEAEVPFDTGEEADGAAEHAETRDDAADDAGAQDRATASGPPEVRAPATQKVASGRRFRRAEGFILRLEGGHTYWRLDGDRIARQVGPHGPEVGPLLVNRTQDAPAAVLQIGYNVLGHVAVGLDVTATGWDVTTRDRGGAGFLAATVAWHPVELLAELLPIGFIRDRFWDVSVFGGAGYGVLGKDRAMDGMHLAFGARAEVFPARWISIGATLRQYPLRFDRYVLHWDNGVDVELPERSGGSVLVPTFTVALRVPPGV